MKQRPHSIWRELLIPYGAMGLVHVEPTLGLCSVYTTKASTENLSFFRRSTPASLAFCKNSAIIDGEVFRFAQGNSFVSEIKTNIFVLYFSRLSVTLQAITF